MVSACSEPRGCVECHDGPLFSELYERQPLDRVAKNLTMELERIAGNNSPKADGLKALRTFTRQRLDEAKDPKKAVDPRQFQDKNAQLNQQLQQRVQRAISEAKPTDSPTSVFAPGSAYQFNPQWARSQAMSPPSVNGTTANPPRGPGDPPACDPDKKPDFASKPIDTTWNRSDPQYDAQSGQELRRSDTYFLSRARRLVTHEERWGYRKPFLHDNELMFWGAFKTPTLRNVELTAPYMHNGRLMTLMDVVEFYEHERNASPVRFIPRDLTLNPDKHPAMKELEMTKDDKLALVFFLKCLTDDRVKNETGPFDHPSLRIPHGYDADLKDIYDDIPASVTEY